MTTNTNTAATPIENIRVGDVMLSAKNDGQPMTVRNLKTVNGNVYVWFVGGVYGVEFYAPETTVYRVVA